MGFGGGDDHGLYLNTPEPRNIIHHPPHDSREGSPLGTRGGGGVMQ